jgi:hypothetical protein
VLVVSELAFACVLLVGAGLLLRSFVRVLDVDLGFRPAHAITLPRRSRRVVRHAREAAAYIDEVLRASRACPASRRAGSPTRCRSARTARGACARKA